MRRWSRWWRARSRRSPRSRASRAGEPRGSPTSSSPRWRCTRATSRSSRSPRSSSRSRCCDGDAWRRALPAMAACAVCWIPLAVLALSRGSGQLFWIAAPDLQARAAGRPGAHLGRIRAELPAGRGRHTAGDPDRRAVARSPRSGSSGGPRWGPVLALSWLVVPVGLMWLWSFVGQPIFTPRNLLVSLPAVGVAARLGARAQPSRTGLACSRSRS